MSVFMYTSMFMYVSQEGACSAAVHVQYYMCVCRCWSNGWECWEGGKWDMVWVDQKVGAVGGRDLMQGEFSGRVRALKGSELWILSLLVNLPSCTPLR
jgi:hypothetical protein